MNNYWWISHIFLYLCKAGNFTKGDMKYVCFFFRQRFYFVIKSAINNFKSKQKSWKKNFHTTASLIRKSCLCRRTRSIWRRSAFFSEWIRQRLKTAAFSNSAAATATVFWLTLSICRTRILSALIWRKTTSKKQKNRSKNWI